MGLKVRYILFSAYISYTKQVEGSGVFVQQAIAILDSGVGGLTVVKEVMRQLPRRKSFISRYGPSSVRTPFDRGSNTVYRTNCRLFDPV